MSSPSIATASRQRRPSQQKKEAKQQEAKQPSADQLDKKLAREALEGEAAKHFDGVGAVMSMAVSFSEDEGDSEEFEFEDGGDFIDGEEAIRAMLDKDEAEAADDNLFRIPAGTNFDIPADGDDDDDLSLSSELVLLDENQHDQAKAKGDAKEEDFDVAQLLLEIDVTRTMFMDRLEQIKNDRKMEEVALSSIRQNVEDSIAATKKSMTSALANIWNSVSQLDKKYKAVVVQRDFRTLQLEAAKKEVAALRAAASSSDTPASPRMSTPTARTPVSGCALFPESPSSPRVATAGATSVAAPDTPTNAGVPTAGVALEDTPDPSAVAALFSSAIDDDASADLTAAISAHGADSTASSTPATALTMPPIIDLVSLTTTTSPAAVVAGAAASSGCQLFTTSAASPITNIRGPHHSSTGTPLRATRTPPATSNVASRRASLTTARKVAPFSSRSPPQQNTPLHGQTPARSSGTPTSTSLAGKQRPPMRFGGAGAATRSPLRPLPEGRTSRRTSLNAGGALGKPLGSSPVHTVSAAAARKASLEDEIFKRASRSPLLPEVAALSASLARSPLQPVALNCADGGSREGPVGSPLGATQVNKGAASPSLSGASVGGGAAGWTRPSSTHEKENAAGGGTAARAPKTHIFRGKTMSKLVQAAEAAAAAVAAEEEEPTTRRRSARTTQRSKRGATKEIEEAKVAVAAAAIPRSARRTAAARRAGADPEKTGAVPRRVSARLAAKAEADSRPRWRS